MDNNEIEQIVKDQEPKLRGFLRRRLGNEADAEDVYQDTMVQLVNALNIAENPIEQVGAWLFRVAKNLIINKAKKKHEEPYPATQYDDDGSVLHDFSELFAADSNDLPDVKYLRAMVWEEFDAALAELPEEQREAFILTEMEGLPVKEVAQAAGISVNTLLSRKHYAVLHIRKQLSALYNELLCKDSA